MLPATPGSRVATVVALLIGGALLVAGLCMIGFGMRGDAWSPLVFALGIVAFGAAYAIPMQVLPAIEKPKP